MRITLLTNRDLASNIALNLLLPALSDRHQLEVFCSSSVGTPSAHPDMATLQFLEQTLPNDLLFPMIDAQAREGELLTFQRLEHYLKSPTRSLNAPNSPEGLEVIRATAPDLMVSIRYGRILHTEALSIPDRGVLNLHSGRLPTYRGVMATFRAMLAQDEDLCSTLHWIEDESIDTGRVISFQSHRRRLEACYLSNTLSLYPAGCEAVLEAVSILENRGNLPRVEHESSGTYYSFPDEGSLQRFNQAGYQWAASEFLTRLYSRYLPQSSNDAACQRDPRANRINRVVQFNGK